MSSPFTYFSFWSDALLEETKTIPKSWEESYDLKKKAEKIQYNYKS